MTTRAFTLSAALLAATLCPPADAARQLPERLRYPSRRLVGLDLTGAAAIARQWSAPQMPAPKVGPAPVRRLILRPAPNRAGN